MRKIKTSAILILLTAVLGVACKATHDIHVKNDKSNCRPVSEINFH